MDMTQRQMTLFYSRGHAYAHLSAASYLGSGNIEKARAWQMTQRAWFQHRATAMGMTDAQLDTFRLDDAAEAHNGGPIYATYDN
jgi:hypothetical protein